MKTIPSIGGTVFVNNPQKITTFIFNPVAENVFQEVDGIRVTIDSISEAMSIFSPTGASIHSNLKNIFLQISGNDISLKDLKIFTRFLDENTEDVSINYLQMCEGSIWPQYSCHEIYCNEKEQNAKCLYLTISLIKPPSQLKLKIVHDTKRIPYDFDLCDTALTLWEKRPATIAPLDFSPHNAPVSVTYTPLRKTDKEKLEDEHNHLEYYMFTITNNSNKTISGIELGPVIKYKKSDENHIATFWVNISKKLEPGQTYTIDRRSISFGDDFCRTVQDCIVEIVKFADENIWKSPEESKEEYK